MGSDKSIVVWIQCPSLLEEKNTFSVSALESMLEAGLEALTGLKEPADAWRRYFSPRDNVGIKVNCLGGRNMCTHPALASAAAKSLCKMGLAPHQILVWDRSTLELQRCGFPVNKRARTAYRCFGTDEKGFGYERELTAQGSIGSLFSTLLTRQCTAFINMPVLKDHALCGLTAAMKNIFGALHNPNKYHEDRCDPYIADANAVPVVRKKQRLIICDALQVQYKGGPAYHPQWVKPFGSLLLAEDPVALDTVCTKILNQIRLEQALPPIEKEGRLPDYILTAADENHRLGQCLSKNIGLIKKTINL